MRTRRSQFSSNPMSADPLPKADGHRTVLLHEAVTALAIQKGDTVVDATLGGAGHAKEILTYLGTDGTFIGFDADRNAIERARTALDVSAGRSVHLVHSNFRHLGAELKALGISGIDRILYDLGWSSFQLTEGRGFSFLADEPLSMSYSEGSGLNAGVIVNEWSEESLADVIYGFGEERYARRIARAIVEARTQHTIQTARELGEIVKQAVPTKARFGRLHPATKTFQAIRIAVNDELGALQEGLNDAFASLRPGGRIAVISFHSLEDRLVKRMFADWARKGSAIRITKKPQLPSADEISVNPRSRSAKLRVIEKIHE